MFVEYIKDGESWTPLACKTISAMTIVIICVSILVAIGKHLFFRCITIILIIPAIALFITYIIVVNLRDRREYLK